MSQFNPAVGARGPKNRLWRPLLAPVLAMVAALGLSACDDDNNAITTPQGAIRVLHASPDAPPVNVRLDGTVAISALDYARSTGFVNIAARDYDIAVEGIIPGGNADVITVNGFTVAGNDRTTIIAADVLAGITPLVLGDSAAAPGANEVAVRVVHASPAANALVAAVDVYVTDPAVDIANVMPTFSFAFLDDVDAGALAAGTVRIRITAAGSKAVVYDSGGVDLAPFAGGQLLIVAIDTTNSTEQIAAPVKLLVASDTAHVVLLDDGTLSGARVVHAAPDADGVAGGAVEVFASSAALPASPTELIDAFSYLDVVPAVDSFVDVPAGDYVFDVAPDTNTIGDSVYTSGTASLDPGGEYTVVATGRLASAPPFTLLLAAEDLRPVSTQAGVRIMHAAPAAGTVDVYVTDAGAFTTAEVENGMAGAPLLAAVAFGDITGKLAVPPGNYDIRVVAAGSVAINVPNVGLAAGSVSTVIARGPIEPAGGGPGNFDLILLTN